MSDLKDFVIEEGVLKKYVGEGGEVVIPDGVTHIGEEAFSGFFHTMGISVTIPHSVKIICRKAFRGCNGLSELIIPDNVEGIGFGAFHCCFQLKKVVVSCWSEEAFDNDDDKLVLDLRKQPVSLLKNFKQKALSLICYFENRENGIEYEESVIKENTAYIKRQRKKLYEYALQNTLLLRHMLNEKIVPMEDAILLTEKLDDLVSVESKAMLVAYINSFGNKTKEKVVKKQEKKIEKDLSTDSYSEEGLKMTWNFKKNSDGTIMLNSLKQETEIVEVPEKIGVFPVTALNDRCFKDKKNLKEILIPDTITWLGKKLFWGCENLDRVVVGAGVKEIESGVFSECTAQEIVLKHGIEVIGESAFYKCSNLTKITLPDSITFIGEKAFSYCKKLKYNVKDGIKYLGNDERPYLYLMKGSNKLASVEIDAKCKIIAPWAFDECDNISDVRFPDEVQTISPYAFRACKTLRKIEIPHSVISIGKAAFYGCSELKEINLGENLVEIGKDAFEGCGYLEEENNWNNGELYIGLYLMRANSEVVGEYQVREGIKGIAPEAFGGCDGITSVILPNTIHFIGEDAFSNCANLKNITLPEGINSINCNTFWQCTNLTEVVMPNSVKYIKENAFAFCANLSDINFSNTLQKIDEGAFSFCENLSSVVLPDSLRAIGKEVFQHCENLKHVVIPESVEEIDEEAFGWGWNQDMLICARVGSYAEEYAKKKKIKFEAL